MELESQKAIQFVNRLLSNPAIQSLYPLQRETQILQFLKVNIKQHLPNLSSAAFFPGKTWESIITILYKALMDILNKDLFTGLGKILDEIGYGKSGTEVRQILKGKGFDSVIDEFMNEIVLFDKNKKGYENLMYLSSKAFIEGMYYFQRINKKEFTTIR